MNRRSAATSGGAEIQKNVTGFLKDNAAMIALLIIVLLLIALFAPQFFSVQNITNVARQASTCLLYTSPTPKQRRSRRARFRPVLKTRSLTK